MLENDKDHDGDTLSMQLLTSTADGLLTWSPDGSFSYSPNGGFTGTDTFTYQAFDGAEYSNVAIVTLFVMEEMPTLNDLSDDIDDALTDLYDLVGEAHDKLQQLDGHLSNMLDRVADFVQSGFEVFNGEAFDVSLLAYISIIDNIAERDLNDIIDDVESKALEILQLGTQAVARAEGDKFRIAGVALDMHYLSRELGGVLEHVRLHLEWFEYIGVVLGENGELAVPAHNERIARLEGAYSFLEDTEDDLNLIGVSAIQIYWDNIEQEPDDEDTGIIELNEVFDELDFLHLFGWVYYNKIEDAVNALLNLQNGLADAIDEEDKAAFNNLWNAWYGEQEYLVNMSLDITVLLAIAADTLEAADEAKGNELTEDDEFRKKGVRTFVVWAEYFLDGTWSGVNAVGAGVEGNAFWMIPQSTGLFQIHTMLDDPNFNDWEAQRNAVGAALAGLVEDSEDLEEGLDAVGEWSI